MSPGHTILITLAVLCLFMGAGAVVAGAIGDSWYLFGSNIRIGLWKTCIRSICIKRSNIFEFGATDSGEALLL